MSYQTAILYLSSGGESFEHPKIITESLFKEVDFEVDQVHPTLKEAQNCKTHQAVLTFLDKVIQDQAFLTHVNLWHMHNPKYSGHSLNIGLGVQKGVAHQDSIEKMISFVNKRIQEKNSPHAVFDKIGKGLGHTFRFLSKAASIPIVGIVPATIKILIGTIQVISGLVVSILAAIPAIFSVNARIILQRSAKHIGYGILNMLIGVIEAIPLVGTWTYNNFSLS